MPEPGPESFGVVFTLKQWGTPLSKYRNDSILEDLLPSLPAQSWPSFETRRG